MEKDNKPIQRESSDSGIVSPEKDRILKQHERDFPEGDPAVRRQNPDRGEIPITETDGSVMHVFEKDREKDREKDQKKKAG